MAPLMLSMMVFTAGLGEVRNLIYGEVDPLVERAPIYPFFAGVPAFHRRRIQQVLPHYVGGVGIALDAKVGEPVGPHQLDNAGYQLGWTFHLLEPGLRQ